MGLAGCGQPRKFLMKGTAIIVEDKIVVEWDSDSLDPKPWREMLRLIQSLADAKFVQRPEAHWELPASPFHAASLIKALTNHSEIFIEKGIEKLSERYYFLLEWEREGGAWDQKRMPWVRPYQQSAITFVGALDQRAVVADDVGLGKTIEALGAIWQYARGSRVLVVAPANVIYKWEREILDPRQRFPWSSKWSAQVLVAVQTQSALSDFTICSYDIMRRRVDELATVGFDLIIFDEVHYIKNYKALRTKAAEKLAEGVPHIIGLTGTPLLNDRPIEMYSWLHIVRPRDWPELWGGTGYGDRYCGGRTQYTTFTGATHLPELADRLKTTSIRRIKAEVLSELPELLVSPVPAHVNLGEYKKIEKNVQEAILALSSSSKGYWISVLDRMGYLRLAVGKAKTQVAIEWATDFLDSQPPSRKLVIYCHHRDVVSAIADGLTSWGVVRITGDTKAADRDRYATSFQSEDNHRIMLISDAGGVGIDLFGIGGVEISDMLMVELPWRPADVEQAVGRLHRLGQRSSVSLWALEAKGTIDEYILLRLFQKDDLIAQVVGDHSIVQGLIDQWR